MSSALSIQEKMKQLQIRKNFKIGSLCGEQYLEFDKGCKEFDAEMVANVAWIRNLQAVNGVNTSDAYEYSKRCLEILDRYEKFVWNFGY